MKLQSLAIVMPPHDPISSPERLAAAVRMCDSCFAFDKDVTRLCSCTIQMRKVAKIHSVESDPGPWAWNPRGAAHPRPGKQLGSLGGATIVLCKASVSAPGIKLTMIITRILVL